MTESLIEKLQEFQVLNYEIGFRDGAGQTGLDSELSKREALFWELNQTIAAMGTVPLEASGGKPTCQVTVPSNTSEISVTKTTEDFEKPDPLVWDYRDEVISALQAELDALKATREPVSVEDVRKKIRDLWLTHSNEEEGLIKAILDAAGVKYGR